MDDLNWTGRWQSNQHSEGSEEQQMNQEKQQWKGNTWREEPMQGYGWLAQQGIEGEMNEALSENWAVDKSQEENKEKPIVYGIVVAGPGGGQTTQSDN